MLANSSAGLSIINKYQIVQTCYSGSMSITWLALNSDIGTKVIISKSTFSLSILGYSPEHFTTLGKRLISISSKNIIKVIEFGILDDCPFLVMEYLEGDNFRSYLQQSGTVNLYSLLRIYIQIASALTLLQTKNILHCDIKPDNILINSEGNAVLSDFGVSRTVEYCDEKSPGVLWGSRQYIAPELVLGHYHTFQTDIFSFGVMLYETLTNSLPFKSIKTSTGYLFNHVDQTFTTNDLHNSCPPSLASIVERCIAINAVHRYKSMSEVQIDLSRLTYSSDFHGYLNKFDNDRSEITTKIE